MRNICFNGSSLTAGFGLPSHQRELVYDVLLKNSLNANIENLSVGAESNLEIFKKAISAIRSKKYHIIINQWTFLNRFWLYPRPNNPISFNGNNKFHDVRSALGLTVSKKKIKQMCETYLMLNHDYNSLIDLIDYSIVLDDLGKLHNVHIIHLNGYVDIGKDLIEFDPTNLHKSLSKYNQELIEFNFTNEETSLKHLYLLQEKIKNLELSNWVNFFESINQLKLDIGPLGHHLGKKTHKLIASMIEDHIKLNKIICRKSQ